MLTIRHVAFKSRILSAFGFGLAVGLIISFSVTDEVHRISTDLNHLALLSFAFEDL